MKTYNAVIVGCGRIGSLFSKDPLRKGVVTHADAYRNNPYTRLVAACDINKERLSDFGKTWNIKSLYTDVKEMLEREDVDILSICTPPSAHYPVLKEAVRFPVKAIFCEKPLADSVDAGKEMVKLCRKKGIVLQVDHQRRFDPLHIDLKNLIMRKKLGGVQQANFYYTAGVKNTGSHMFDLLRFLFGDVEWVEAFFSKNVSGRGDDPNLDGILRFKSGLTATFQACDINKYLIFELNCILEEGRFVLKNSGFELDLYKKGASKYFSGYKELLRAKVPFKTVYERKFMANAVDHLVKCINKGTESRSAGVDGLEVLRIIELSVSSANSNGKRMYLNKE
jgi:predicted dehydrogenase